MTSVNSETVIGPFCWPLCKIMYILYYQSSVAVVVASLDGCMHLIYIDVAYTVCHLAVTVHCIIFPIQTQYMVCVLV